MMRTFDFYAASTLIPANHNGPASSLRSDFASLTSAELAAIATVGRQDRPSVVKALFATVSKWFTVRAAARELYEMDEHMLSDIGLTRGMIEDAARGRIAMPIPAAPKMVAAVESDYRIAA